MKSLSNKQVMNPKGVRLFELLRSSWAAAMNRLTKDLTRTQLYGALTGFIIIGVLISIYAGVRGLWAQRPASIEIDAVSVIRSPYREERTALELLEIPVRNDRKESRLDRYIDSVIKGSDKHNNLEVESCSAGFMQK